MFSAEVCPRRESPIMGIGGLRRSGGRVNGAGTGGTSSAVSLETEKVLSGVTARKELGVMLRS
jgi:hypothetical protein